AKRCLVNLNSSALKPYLDFSQTTLLVANQQLDVSYKHAEELNSQLQGQKDTDPTLMALNRLRLGALQRAMNSLPEEKQTLSALKDSAIASKASEGLGKIFETGRLNYEDYIAERTQAIQSQPK
ncbi:MAG: hypothetical protein KDK40_01515, partial [Chlamydiia bacterium]|nr:hypothetical protein [Chlamydiia bacterium]